MLPYNFSNKLFCDVPIIHLVFLEEDMWKADAPDQHNCLADPRVCNHYLDTVQIDHEGLCEILNGKLLEDMARDHPGSSIT